MHALMQRKEEDAKNKTHFYKGTFYMPHKKNDLKKFMTTYFFLLLIPVRFSSDSPLLYLSPCGQVTQGGENCFTKGSYSQFGMISL